MRCVLRTHYWNKHLPLILKKFENFFIYKDCFQFPLSNWSLDNNQHWIYVIQCRQSHLLAFVKWTLYILIFHCCLKKNLCPPCKIQGFEIKVQIQFHNYTFFIFKRVGSLNCLDKNLYLAYYLFDPEYIILTVLIFVSINVRVAS